MLATTLEGQTAGVDTNAGRPLSPRAAQGSPLPVPGAGSATENQSHSEPIPQVRPHPERIARKYYQLRNMLVITRPVFNIIKNNLQDKKEIIVHLFISEKYYDLIFIYECASNQLTMPQTTDA